MKLPVWLTGMATIVAIGLSAPEAHARQLVLSGQTLRAEFAPTGFGILNSGEIGGERGFFVDRRSLGVTSESIVGIGAGASYGIDGKLEVGAFAVPLAIAPDVDYGDPVLHARYLLAQGDFDLAAQAAIRVDFGGTWGVGLGAPVMLHLDQIEVETGIELEILVPAGSNRVNLDLPAAFLVNLSDQLFAGVRSGLFLPEFEELALPLGAVAGMRLSSQGLKMELIGSFRFPRFVATFNDDVFYLSRWTLNLGVNVFLPAG